MVQYLMDDGEVVSRKEVSSDQQMIEISVNQYTDWLMKLTVLKSIIKILEANTLNTNEDKVEACLALIEDDW